jgi:hypothetical protein
MAFPHGAAAPVAQYVGGYEGKQYVTTRILEVDTASTVSDRCGAPQRFGAKTREGDGEETTIVLSRSQF